MKKWFLPISNPTSTSPFRQGIQMSSIAEFTELCEEEPFSFFLNSSKKYSQNITSDSELFSMFLTNLNYLITTYEFDFFNCITKQFKEEITNYSIKYKINLSEHFSKPINRIVNLGYIGSLIDNPFFPFNEWIYNSINVRFEDSEIDLLLKNKIPHFNNEQHEKVIAALFCSDAKSSLKNSNYFQQLLMFYVSKLKNEDSMSAFESKYHIKPLYYYLNNNSIGVESTVYYLYSTEDNFSLFNYNSEDNSLLLNKFISLLTLDKISTKPYYDCSYYGEPSINELKQLFIDNLFIKNKEKDFYNFDLFFNISSENIYKIYFQLTLDENDKETPFDFFAHNPYQINSPESLLWKENILYSSLLSNPSNDLYNFEKIQKINIEHIPFFNNFLEFFKESLNANISPKFFTSEIIEKILHKSITLIDRNSKSIDFFKDFFLTTVTFAHYHNIPINIPLINIEGFTSQSNLILNLEEKIMEITVPIHHIDKKVLKF